MKKRYLLLLFLIFITGCINNFENLNVNDEVNIVKEENALDNYPIILVHGHAVSIGEAANLLKEYNSRGTFSRFKTFQEKLHYDGMYEDKDIILPNQDQNIVCPFSWNKKISVRTTYYVDENWNFDDKRSIKDYAERLGNVVEIVKKCTNSDKVNLIGHSMGGLVIREYTKNNENNVNKVITIGTPNKGLPKNYFWGSGSFCDEFRYENDLECSEMLMNSNFLNELNTKKINNLYTISGVLGKNKSFIGITSCLDHGYCNDGVICMSSGKLENAYNYVAYSDETSSFIETVGHGIHGDLINPDTNVGNKVYDIIKNILMNNIIEENYDYFNNLCSITRPEASYDVNFDYSAFSQNSKKFIENLFEKAKINY